MKNISLDIREDGVGIATLNMPGRPLNVFSEHMMDDLESVIDRASAEMKGLVLCSGKSTFVAGADLVMIKDFANMRFDVDWQTMRDRFSRLGKLFRKIEKSPIPVVAAVNGLALGGGLELAMACHARVCVDTPAPILGLPEILLALLPGAGGTQRLPRYIGVVPAMKMLLEGSPVTPAFALAHGLVDQVVTQDELLEQAVERVKNTDPCAPWDKPGWQLPEADKALLSGENWLDFCLETGGWKSKQPHLYPAVRHIINCVGNGLALPIDEGFDVEWDIFVDLMSDPIAANMVVTCFLNKTAAPKWAQSYIAPNAARLETLAWESAAEMSKGVARKVTLVSRDDAEVVVTDAGYGTSEECIELCNAAQGDTPSSSSASLTYAGSLKSAEAVEVYASEEISACVLDLAMAMGKTPVWKLCAQGGFNLIFDSVRQAVTTCGLNLAAVSRAARAIDAEALFSMAGVQVSTDDLAGDDRAAGLNMLSRVALLIREGCEDRYEETDVLAVLGAGWPRWTGGPIAFLAMLQRNELPDFEVAPDIQVSLDHVGHELKIKASYNISIASHGHL